MSYLLVEKERFIELRLDGLSYSKIAAATGINKKNIMKTHFWCNFGEVLVTFYRKRN